MNFDTLLFNPDVDYYFLNPKGMNTMSSISDLRASELTLRDRNHPSSALSLLTGNLPDIKSLCGYVVITGRLPRSVFKVANDMVILNNI